MSVLEVKNISYYYNKDRMVVDDVSKCFEKGKMYVILGPSGCGKTTLLSLLGGLDIPKEGEVLFEGQTVHKKKLEEHRRDHVSFVFQNYNLIDYMTPIENVELTARQEAWPVLEKLGLSQDEVKRNVLKLSGGQQQRVAIARALVKMPKVLLLDEPLSNLDARLRLQTREEIRRIQKETGITTIFVTHDQEEAMSISDRIVVMKEGVVQQTGSAQEVYDEPVNLFVAKFLGTPPINLFEGMVKEQMLYIGEEAVLHIPDITYQGEVYVGVRPEGFLVQEDGPLSCQLDGIEVMGRDSSIISVNRTSLTPKIRSIISSEQKIDTTKSLIRFALRPHKTFLFDKKSGKRIPFRTGSHI